MATKFGKQVTLLLLATALPLFSADAVKAGPILDWLFGRTTYYYVPVQPVVVAQPTVVQQPYVAARPVAAQSYVVQRPVVAQPQVVQYAPVQYAAIPAFRTSWFRAPVTYYRPVVTMSPVVGSPVVGSPAVGQTVAYYGGCTTQQWQSRRMPTTYYYAPIVTNAVPRTVVSPAPAANYPTTSYPRVFSAAPSPAIPPATSPSAPSTRLAPADQAPVLNKPSLDGGATSSDGKYQGSPAAEKKAEDENKPMGSGTRSSATLYKSVPPRAVLTPVTEPAPRLSTPEASRPSLRLLPDPDWRRESPAAPPLAEPQDRTARRTAPRQKYTKIAWPAREPVRQASAYLATPVSVDAPIDASDSGWRPARGR